VVLVLGWSLGQQQPQRLVAVNLEEAFEESLLNQINRLGQHHLC
jgi:hypothetical protein